MELNEAGTHIELRFSFDTRISDKLREVPGGKFKNKDDDPHWYWQAEITTARRIQSLLRDDLVLGKRIKRWGYAQTSRNDKLIKLALGDQAPLSLLPEALPELAEAIHLGPKGLWMTPEERVEALSGPGSFQTADVSFLAQSPNPLNANHPGLGKTIETIASIYEAGESSGAHLIIAPKTSLETVWQKELLQWQWLPVLCCATDSKREREEWVALAQQMHADGEDFWMIVNPQMVSYNGVYEWDPYSEKNILVGVESPFPAMHEIIWRHVILDEIHKAGFRNLDSLMAKGIFGLEAERRIALSGTPIGGKAINLWNILYWLNPKVFPSKWRFAEQFLEISEEKYHVRGGKEKTSKKIGGISSAHEEEMYRTLTPHMLRRTKEECLPWLPPKQHISVECSMGRKQLAQYQEFARAAEIRIEEETLSATSILAEYTRLKQFAISLNAIEYYEENGERKFRPVPTFESCKLEALEEQLVERGYMEGEPTEQLVIVSQFTQVCEMIQRWLLEKHKVESALLTGKTNKKGQRTQIQRDFQAGEGPKIVILNIYTGGVSIQLDMADSIHFLDETWEPDDQEQAADRLHRASRNHQVTCYYYRTNDTIEQYIEEMNLSKQNVNTNILDLRREGLRAVHMK